MSAVQNSAQSPRVLITGGSRGIGLEVARDLAASGHQLWLAATSEKVREAAAQLGPAHRASRVDVADPNSVASLFAEIRREWQGLDAVIHSAAELGQTGNFWQLDPEKFARTLPSILPAPSSSPEPSFKPGSTPRQKPRPAAAKLSFFPEADP